MPVLKPDEKWDLKMIGVIKNICKAPVQGNTAYNTISCYEHLFFLKSTKLIGVDLGSMGFHHGNNISQHGVDLGIIKE